MYLEKTIKQTNLLFLNISAGTAILVNNKN